MSQRNAECASGIALESEFRAHRLAELHRSVVDLQFEILAVIRASDKETLTTARSVPLLQSSRFVRPPRTSRIEGAKATSPSEQGTGD